PDACNPTITREDFDFVLVSFHGRGMWENDLPFCVEIWDDKDSHIEEIIVLTSDYWTAKSSYPEAVKRRPGRIITLRQTARVIQSKRMNCDLKDCGQTRHL